MLSDRTIVLENIPFTIEHERVLREMRVSRIRTLDELEAKPLADVIRNAIDAAYGLIRGRGVWRSFRLTGVEADRVAGESVGDLFTGKNMVKLLSECDHATLLACTIGPALEEEVQRRQDAGELTGAYALEMVGGWMADYMAGRVDEQIEYEVRKRGYDRTMRYSPGYGDWPLEKQPDALRLVEAERIGITLTDTNIMLPRKSVSAVIGWKRIT